MAVGFTINHIAAVFLPALGGYFWMISYRIPFIAGAILGVVSLIAAQFMRSHHKPTRSRKSCCRPTRPARPSRFDRNYLS